MPVVAVSRERQGAHGRQSPIQNHLHPTLEHPGRSCSHHRLHGGSDAARALHGRLLLLPGGPTIDSPTLTEDGGCARGIAPGGAIRVHFHCPSLADGGRALPPFSCASTTINLNCSCH